MRGTIKLALISTALLTLAGCRLGADIAISYAPGGVPRFEITTRDDALPCIDYIEVWEVAVGNPGEVADLWHARRSDGGKCTNAFVFGQDPPGYERVRPVNPTLVVGKTYRVAVDGGGISDHQDFIYEGAR